MSVVNSICLIDDDSVYQFVTTSNIRKFNKDIKITTYENGEEALIGFKKILELNEDMPDVILLDINMPILDGWQFLEGYAIMRSQIKTPVHIYMTSSSLDTRDVSRAKGYPDVRRFLHKPIDSKTIAVLVQEFNEQ